MTPLVRTTRVAAGLLVGVGIALAALPASGTEYDEIVLTRDETAATLHLDGLPPTGAIIDQHQKGGAVRPDTCRQQADCAAVPIRVSTELRPDEDAVLTITVSWPQRDPGGPANAVPDLDAWLWAEADDCPAEVEEEPQDETLPDPEPPTLIPPYDGCVESFSTDPATNPIVLTSGNSFSKLRWLTIVNAIGPNLEGIDVSAHLDVARREVAEPPIPSTVIPPPPTVTIDAAPVGTGVTRSAVSESPRPAVAAEEATILAAKDVRPPRAIADIATGSATRLATVATTREPSTSTSTTSRATGPGPLATASLWAVLGAGTLPVWLLAARRRQDHLPVVEPR